VDPLSIPGQLREAIDHALIDQHPARHAELTPDVLPQRRERVFRRGADACVGFVRQLPVTNGRTNSSASPSLMLG
jgi:hypothetical protein